MPLFFIFKLPFFMPRSILILFTCLIFTSCFKAPEGGFGQEEQHQISDNEIEGYWIKFYKIDNQVKVLVNGQQIFDSGKNEDKTTEEISVGLTKYIKSGKNQVRIELYNDPPYEGFMGFDKHWEVFYELFKRDIPIDYIHESGDDGKQGQVWYLKHDIEVE